MYAIRSYYALAKATEWRDTTLTGTPFGSLPIHEAEAGFFLVASARKGDSLGGVVADYARAAGIPPASRREILMQAEEHHVITSYSIHYTKLYEVQQLLDVRR